jgi:hypothetical protein
VDALHVIGTAAAVAGFKALAVVALIKTAAWSVAEL